MTQKYDLGIVKFGFFERRGQMHWAIKHDLRDSTVMQSEDRHRKGWVSVLGPFTQF